MEPVRYRLQPGAADFGKAAGGNVASDSIRSSVSALGRRTRLYGQPRALFTFITLVSGMFIVSIFV